MARLKLVGPCIFFISLWIFMSLVATPAALFAKEKPIELKMSVMMGTKSSKYKNGFEPWAKKIEEVTNGKVKVVIFPSNSLAAARQNYDACIDGIVDIGWIAITHYPGRFPLTEILTVPGLTVKDPIVDSEVTWGLYKKFPEIQKEFADVKVLFMHAFAPLVVASTKPIRSLEDVKGMKIRAPKGCAELLKAAGAAPMFMPPSEIFLNMQKGVIDGSAMGWEGQRSFGALKLAKYFTLIPALPGNHFVMYMNKKKWEKLSPELQKAISSVSGDYAARLFGEADHQTGMDVIKQINAMEGSEIIYLSPEENVRWTDLSLPIQERMVANIEEKGLPGKNAFMELVKMLKEAK